MRPLRFNVASLITLQIMLAPLFLSFIYREYQSGHLHIDPFTTLIAIVAPPLVYVVILVLIMLRRAGSAASVFAGIRLGVPFGLLFGLLAWGPIGVPGLLRSCGAVHSYLSDCMRQGLELSWQLFFEAIGAELHAPAIVFTVWFVHYLVFGAAAGAVGGMLMNRRRSNAVDTPRRAD